MSNIDFMKESTPSHVAYQVCLQEAYVAASEEKAADLGIADYDYYKRKLTFALSINIDNNA